MKSKSVAIMGSGPAGLVSAKVLSHYGLDVTVFERNDSIGGAWNPVHGQTWPSMHTNISRYSMRFSDLEWDHSVPAFPYSNDVFNYLNQYADVYALKPLVRFNTLVKTAKQVDSLWLIEIESVETGFCECLTFNYFIVANGIFSKPYIPPHLDNTSVFHENNLVIHSAYYKTYRDRLKNKEVVIVGSSFSACEIACDLCDHASKITVIINEPYWVVPRYFPINAETKVPFDFLAYTRNECYKDESYEFRNQKLSKTCKKQMEVECLRLDPNSNAPPKLVVSDTFVDHVKSGKIEIKKAKVSKFDNDDGVLFEDGTSLKTDAVILCTGYSTSLNMFDEEILQKLEFDPDDRLKPLLLYKATFHPDVKNLAFVGVFRGTYFSTLELQAKWAAMVFTEQLQLPDRDRMLNGILNEKKIKLQIPQMQFPYKNYVLFTDSIAEEIHALPDFKQIEKENPALYQKLWFNIVIPEHYILHENETKALKAIEDTELEFEKQKIR